MANARDKTYRSLKGMSGRLDIEYKSIETYEYVASKYELPMRIGSLSFNHHQIAAPEDDRLD